jgi:hypothetical protein
MAPRLVLEDEALRASLVAAAAKYPAGVVGAVMQFTGVHVEQRAPDDKIPAPLARVRSQRYRGME